MTEFKVPELGENVAGGDVMRVMVNPGDTIARDQPVLELETDKATIEVPSTVAGTVKEVRVKKGDKVSVGAVVFTVDEGASGGNGASSSQQAGKAEEKPAAQPQKSEAPPAAESKPAAETRPDHKVISMPPRGAPEAPAVAPPPPPPPAARADGNGERGPVAPASPAVRRLAREIGVNVDEVQGTGPGGRISQEDVKEHARRILSSVPSTAGAGGAVAGVRAARPLPDFQKWGEVDRQPLSNIRRVTADHLSYAWNAIPHVTQFDKADVTALEELRKKFKDQIAKAGGNLTVTAMLVRILATAVRKFPQFNASIDTERGELIFKKYVNVGVAVDTDRGLLVPVIRNADRKNISEISIEINQLAARARDKKLTLEEMSGGGISISNLGGIGGTYFTPIVNWPEVAILGVSRTITEPVWKDPSTGAGQAGFQPRQMLPLSLSYDHRVIDGADAMRFLRWVAEAIEQPFLLSLIG
ncbi:MAG TPA: 2-oxo acid dehydrogenase subunit E2 [Vicinamibacterales bacterium]|nr:2-oxo acid dehydrogenase subunit E2 [Vicinamibacterales bacterium]